MKQPILTIAIPTFNRLNDLKACINSIVIASSYTDEVVEIFVSDNNSSDGTKQFLKTYKKKANNIIFRLKINNQNIGGTKNIQSMFEFCNGKYVYWISDDDLMLPNALNDVIGVIKLHSPTYIRTAMIVNLIKSKKAFYYGLNFDGLINLNTKKFWKLLGLSHVLTGTVHINNPKMLTQIKNVDNIYVCVDFLLYSCSKMFSIANVCNIHTWENEVFWEDEINYLTGVKKNKKKASLKLNSDFQSCIINSPTFKNMNKADLIKFLILSRGFLSNNSIKKIKFNLYLILIAAYSYFKFRLIRSTKFIYNFFTEFRNYNGH